MTTVYNVNTKFHKKTHIWATKSASLGLHCTPCEPNLTTQRSSLLKIKVVGACIYIYINHEGLTRFAPFPCKWSEADALMETYYSHKKSHLDNKYHSSLQLHHSTLFPRVQTSKLSKWFKWANCHKDWRIWEMVKASTSFLRGFHEVWVFFSLHWLSSYKNIRVREMDSEGGDVHSRPVHYMSTP